MDSNYHDCDNCGSTEDRLTQCPECEMRFCGECLANYVTDAGCIFCALGTAMLAGLERALDTLTAGVVLP